MRWLTVLAHTDMALSEAVNIIEAGYGQWYHQTRLMACTEEIVRQRLMAHDDFTLEEANQRLGSRRPWEERSPAGDLVLHNDGSYEEFAGRVRAEFGHVRNLWKHGQLPPSRHHD